MLSVDADADAAVEAKVQMGWNKFRQVLPPRTTWQQSRLPSSS